METVKIGKIVNTHGLKGELKIIPSTHFIEERFGKGASILIRKDSVHVHAKVERMRADRGMVYVVLEGLNDINAVEIYKGAMCLSTRLICMRSMRMKSTIRS